MRRCDTLLKLYVIPLVLIASLILASCASSKIRPLPPQPPQINCDSRAAVDAIPAIPDAMTMDQMSVVLSQTIGAYTAEVRKRVTTAECMDVLRSKGIIR